ncbi:hypothetical protein GCM10011418_38810 [Sphingobacterium alkalisoli]|nr:hypothetical protein GCM10011418_38810 [Sphingobacterium alkalisoli]
MPIRAWLRKDTPQKESKSYAKHSSEKTHNSFITKILPRKSTKHFAGDRQMTPPRTILKGK